MKLFNRIKPLDITLVQTDWKYPYEFGHLWIATYYGEPVGKIVYSENRLQVFRQIYIEKEVLLYDKTYSKNWYNVNGLSSNEVKKLRMCRRKFARSLNKINYKHE